ncbi:MULTISPECIES: hypothetical protein [unclassified Variovorax]|uniref:hypothetical protein n=1 Tax=unclassified Variovorax TaxID=663243 RepID=UPI00076C5971|nr:MULTISPECIES: hypothetical protein [unclassified Variovorax]KWT97539.1 hypothetical protein APY03_1469 [Variovorax sp. WDL1]PNG51629.1 hypothetical protein CHC06_05210 [Variovorax sp. B2]PNG54345.1 hypothetical protein CHC07_04174 [Variovorax sp. B4]VTV11840.1 hypothetical protein WDL1CHR_02693 [Variovorax sp. WDL1]
MNWLAPLLVALLVTGCGVPPNQVVPMRDGTLRAATYLQAGNHCQEKGLNARMLGKAQAEQGVLFRCE